jgi:predicted SprT family Zn-dependent metalloprotease
MNNPTPYQQAVSKCKEIFELAKVKYGVDLSNVSVRFDLKGCVAGRAGWKGSKGDSKREYFMQFNLDLLQREPNEMIHDTIPHEIAHIVCCMKPELGSGHDNGWTRVCITLGGSGNTTHDMAVVYGKGTTYEYTTDTGNKVRLNDRHHAHVQLGGHLTYRRGLGQVTKSCEYSIVGIKGKTLATPIKEVPVTTLLPKYTTKAAPIPQMPVIIREQGGSKADVARALMIEGHRVGLSTNEIIANIMLANNHPLQLAISYYKFNAARCGVPAFK